MTKQFFKLLFIVSIVSESTVRGQEAAAYLSLGGRVISNNSDVSLLNLGEDSVNRPTLTCHTNLTECCRGRDTGTVGIGEWYYPSRGVIPNQAAGEDFYRVRNALQLIRLARRESANALTPTGSYCCVIPTTAGEMTVCANLVVCLPLPSLPPSAIVTYSDPTLSSGTVATVQCKSGYYLTGPGTATCQSSGSWTLTAFTCAKSCFDLAQPTNGDIAYSGGAVDARPPATRATYSCDGSSRDCQLQGEWSGSIPRCAFPMCQDLTRPPNGVVEYSDGTFNNRSLGVTAMYSCALGYTLVGGDTRRCQVDETWSGVPSSCIETTCSDELIAPMNGQVMYNSGSENSRPINSTATYSCITGYTLSGEANTTCEITGVWSGSPATCVEIFCSDLIAPPNGNSISYSSGSVDNRPIDSTATYSCIFGYSLDGDSTRTCLVTGSWSEPTVTCVVTTCSDLSSPANGVVSFSSGSTDARPINSTATYSCDTGYTLSGEGNRTCEVTGIWSGSPATCVETVCYELTAPSNGDISYSSGSVNNRPINSTATYSCLIGYTLIGIPNRMCEVTGTWSGLPLDCVVTTCSDLSSPANGVVSFSSGSTDSRPINSTATYSCDTGYTLSGEGNRTCEITGVWSGSPATCVEIFCSDLISPSNGNSISYSSGSVDSRPIDSTATYSCMLGYSLNSTNSERTCEDSSQWSGTSLECVVTTCSDLTSPANGVVSFSSGSIDARSINSTATYSCDTGYNLSGEGNRTCEVTGIWSGSPATCVAVSCGSPDSPMYGSVAVTGTTFMSTATYECDYGYLLLGAENRTCNVSGGWTPERPVCEPDWEALLNQPITAETYAVVADLMSSFASASLNNQTLQSSNGLVLMSRVFGGVAQLVNTSDIIIEPEVVEGTVSTLNSLIQWKPGVIMPNSSSDIIQSHETILSVLAEQRSLNVNFSDISVVVKKAEAETLKALGGMADFSARNGDAASISLPKELFKQLSSDQSSVGVFFAVYESANLFPMTEEGSEGNSTHGRVASSIVAATVGRDQLFTAIHPPVVIELELQEFPEDGSIVACVSWNFTSSSWVTDGCETEYNTSGTTVQCRCTHLTNFALLIDLCSRLRNDCTIDRTFNKVLSVVSTVGVVLSSAGLFVTVLTLLSFRELRERDNTTHNVQLCISVFCLLLVFAVGSEKTDPFPGCVAVSVLIHYFSLAAMIWMGAEAVLMFQKLVLVFGEITRTYLVTVSFICWLTPLIPLLPPLIVDMTNGLEPDSDLIVSRVAEPPNSSNSTQFCFLKHQGVFFGAFLGPIFAILLFNLVIFIWVIVVVLRSTKGKLERANEKLKPKTVLRVMISLIGVMFLFGLSWLFAAFTFTIADSDVLRYTFQALFTVCATFQGFFFFLFFCMFDEKARQAWKGCLFPSRKNKMYSLSNSFGSYRANSRHGSATMKLTYSLSKYSHKVSSPTISQQVTQRIPSSLSSPQTEHLPTTSTSEKTQEVATTSSPSQESHTVSLSQDIHEGLKTPDLPNLHESSSLKDEEC